MKQMLLLPLIVILSSSLTANIVFKDPNAMLHYVKKLLPQAPQILEAGGHFGEDTIKMKKIWPNATIHVFEPLPSSFEKMQNQTNNLKNVTCYPYALTTYSGETNFYIDLPNLVRF